MLSNDRGSVTAEFAVTLPSLILLFFFGLQILSGINAQQRGEAIAQVIARAITRGESQKTIDQIMHSNFPQGKLSISDYDGVVTVEINENEVKAIAEKLGCSCTVADVLEDGFIEKVKSDINDIKGVAYCVGSIDLKPLRMVTEADMNKCMKLNLYSAIEAIKGYQESLKKNKGSVVLFSTVAAQRGFTNHTIIASAKAAVEGLTVTLAAEFAPNIRVNCIAPSLSKSKIAEPMLKNPAIAEGIAKAHPLKRLGEGKDSAALAKFLITEESSWITGQIIAVDGGRSKLS